MATILNSAILDSAMLLKPLTPTNSIWLKVIHSDWTWWWQPSWILPSWIQPYQHKKKLHSCILTQINDGSHLEFCHLQFSHFPQKKLYLIILTQLGDGSHLEFCHLRFSHSGQKNFTHSFSLNLMMAAILNSAIFDSAILHKTLTPTNSMWFKLIHSHLTWWWQPSCIVPSWILPSWIQPFC